MKTITPEIVDWRKNSERTDFDADDAELLHTPQDVVAVLGFDPREFSEIDTVKASDHSPDIGKTMPPALAAARLRAQHIYEASALAAAAALTAKKKADQRRKDEDAVLLLLLLAGEDAYRETHQALVPGADPVQVDEQAKTFAERRQGVLGGFAEKLVKNVRKAQAEAAEENLGETDTARATRQAATNTSDVMTDTEAQVTLGSVELDRLKRAGFTSAYWATCEDERVRPTHVECGEQGAVELGKQFANGLLYPGDPNGPASEVCGCRCWLVGASRKPIVK